MGSDADAIRHKRPLAGPWQRLLPVPRLERRRALPEPERPRRQPESELARARFPLVSFSFPR